MVFQCSASLAWALALSCPAHSPMLQSSSSEPSPQSSNMLQRRAEDKQRWFRHRNSFLSLQWAAWAVGDSEEGGGFRSWYSPPSPPETGLRESMRLEEALVRY